ncbi:MAG: NnrS family protein [Proteobacteria bacterium]|nr:NnrS family protein [Pseudomonadota bacterium]
MRADRGRSRDIGDDRATSRPGTLSFGGTTAAPTRTKYFMHANDSTSSLEIPLLAAPHRTLFFAGLVSLLAASMWWGLHVVARSTGTPVFALALQPAPIWAHAYLMLFAVFPTMFFGFLFTVFPRWMNGPLVTRTEYLATASLFATGTLLWLAGTFAGPRCCCWPAWRLARACCSARCRCSGCCSLRRRSCRTPSSC